MIGERGEEAIYYVDLFFLNEDNYCIVSSVSEGAFSEG